MKVDLNRGKVRVTEQLIRLDSGEWLRKEPKTAAGVRSKTISRATAAILAEHVDRFSVPGLDSLVFPNRAGNPLTKELAGQRPGVFTEAPEEMVRRVTRELGTKRNLVVINDEAHHCYRRRVGADDSEMDAVSGEDKREAAKRDEEARVWITGLQAVAAKTGVRAVYDISATPASCSSPDAATSG